MEAIINAKKVIRKEMNDIITQIKYKEKVRQSEAVYRKVISN